MESLDDEHACNDGVGGGDGGDDVACHLFDFEAGFAVDVVDDRTEIGGGSDKVEGLIVVFIEGQGMGRVGGGTDCKGGDGGEEEFDVVLQGEGSLITEG